MKTFARVVAMLLFVLAVFVESVPYAVAATVDDAVSFDLTRVRVSEVAHLMFRDVLRTPYLLAPEVVNDERLISFRFDASKKTRADVLQLMDSLGLDVSSHAGLDVITLKKEAEPDKEVFVYRPHYRDVNYFTRLLAPMFHGTFVTNRQVAAPTGARMEKQVPEGSAAALVDQSTDVLVFQGTSKEIASLKRVLEQVDTLPGEVVVKGYVYEVGKNDSDGAALDVLLSVLSGRLNVSVSSTSLGNALRVKTANIDAVASMLSTDGRFKVVTSPFTRVRSGGTARFVVGSDVPVLGAIITNQGGQSSQSVEYRSAGTIFEVTPRVRENVTELDLFQQVSSFVNTDTGVNSSPTLNKRELRTSLTVEDGEVLVIGGLNDSKIEDAKSGLSFLPFALSKSHGSRSSELLLVLELKRI
jgi:hypothetical protein